jgi:uncharacterized protein (UPF0335 family)
MPRGAKKQQSNESIDPDDLMPYGDRYERLMEELQAARDAVNDLMTEMKSAGYDTKKFKKAMKVKAIGYEAYEADDQEFHLYLHALGVIRETEAVY